MEFLRKINWKEFFVILGILLGIINVLSPYVKTSQLNIPPLEYNLLLLLLTLTVWSIYTYITEHLLPQKSTRLKIFKGLSSLKKIVNKFQKDDKHYELLLMDWRIASEVEKGEMLHGDAYTLTAYETYAYIKYVFGKILRKLGPSDCYDSLSTLRFWMVNSEVNEKFIRSNLAAAEKGVKIDRIILIDQDLFDQPLAHRDEIIALDKLIEEFMDYLHSEPSMTKMAPLFHITNNITDKYGSAPFATIYREIEKIDPATGMPIKLYMQIVPYFEDENKEPESPFIKIRLPRKEDDTFSRITAEHSKFLALKNNFAGLLTIHKMRDKMKSVMDVKSLDPSRFLAKDRTVLYYLAEHSIVKSKAQINGTLISIQEGDEYITIDSTSNLNKLLSEKGLSIPSENRDDGWILIIINIDQALKISGFINLVSKKLSSRNIPICLYTLFSAEYLLVKKQHYREALNCLTDYGRGMGEHCMDAQAM